MNFTGGWSWGHRRTSRRGRGRGVSLFALETHASTPTAVVGGSGVRDTAIIEDDVPDDNIVPTGLITWNVYGPDDFNCSGDPSTRS